MRYLLDTQILLWALEDNPRLSGTARQILTNDSHQLYVSLASLWEMAIKISIQKLTLAQPLTAVIEHLPEAGIAILPISTAHILAVEHLPLLHRDPFDRLLVAQAVVENLEVVSSDEALAQYPIVVHW